MTKAELLKKVREAATESATSAIKNYKQELKKMGVDTEAILAGKTSAASESEAQKELKEVKEAVKEMRK